ncbi:MAG TPA: acyl-CoA dehydrogenase [Vicinamibacteria bacterium]|nr:acyl-CoA dehydrogenase [Vicinamibacteria bacterium]
MSTDLQAAAQRYPSGLTILSEEEKMFRDMVGKFAEKEIGPLVSKMDREMAIEPSLIPKLFEIGLMGIEVPETYGGSGSSFFMAVLAVEQISRVDASLGVLVDVQNTLVNNALMRWATEEQKKRYLPRLASDTVGAYALSEPDSGSDAFALSTRAVQDGEQYRLTGRKLWITNGEEAGLFIIFATINPGAGYRGITAFLVERDFPGFRVGKKEDKLGIRASSTNELILDDCQVPQANILGEPGKGYKIAMETLNEGRIGIGAQMIGLAQGSLEHGIRYAKERQAFGQAIAKFQAIQFQIARCATDLEAARLLVYNAARLRDGGHPFLMEAAMAKLFSSDAAERVTSQVIEIYGGYGYTKDFPAEKYWRDAKIGKIYEGTSNMQLGTIAKSLLGKD